jgi:hypothetical protein
VVLLVLLAGCAEEPEEEEDPLFGFCPQWLQGPDQDQVTIALNATNLTATTSLRPMEGSELRTEYQDRVLDMYRIRLVSASVIDGSVQMRAFSDDEQGAQKAVRDYRIDGPQFFPVVHLTSEDEGREFDVILTSVSQEQEPAPSALTLAWTFDPIGEGGSAQIVGNVTYHYRVCGADV